MHTAQKQQPIYSYIGQRIRERRKLLKLNQAELSELMGFSYQQMQKYETGVSHVSAGKLLLFAKILNVPPNYFYDGIKLEEEIGKRIESHIIQRTRGRAFRILQVENNPADVILFKKALTAVGPVEVHTIYDSETVLDFLLNHQTKFGQKFPDLVVIDLTLPKLGGLELLKSIKKHPRFMELPVVVLTNSINPKDMTDSYKHGAVGFIQKSVDYDEYVGQIETTIKYWSRVVALPCQ